jgi:hypothetical protein
MESTNATQAMTNIHETNDIFRSLFQKRRRQILNPRPAMENENETRASVAVTHDKNNTWKSTRQN